jgi:hypothetical protein
MTQTDQGGRHRSSPVRRNAQGPVYLRGDDQRMSGGPATIQSRGWVGWAERRVLDRPAKMLTRATPNPSAWSADRAVFGKVVWGIMLKHHEDQ